MCKVVGDKFMRKLEQGEPEKEESGETTSEKKPTVNLTSCTKETPTNQIQKCIKRMD